MTSAGQPAAARTATPIILVVEDEVIIRLDVADYLRHCGYEVLQASDAAEAIEVLQGEVPVDIVFTDVRMPGEMDGFGLALWIKQHRPEIRVILASGHAVQKEADELCAEQLLLTKPYDPANLLHHIRRLFGGS